MNRSFYFRKFYFLLVCLPINLFSFAQTSVPFTLDEEGHMLVEATIDGIPGKFLFDTGAGMTVIGKSCADKIKDLIKQDAGFTGFRETGERISVDLYQGVSLNLGSFTEKNPVIAVFNGDLGPIDGLISLKSFMSQPFTIDFTKKIIVFETSSTIQSIEQNGKIIPLQMDILRDKALDIFAYFKVNEKLTLQLSIDGGAGHNVFFFDTKYARAMGVDTALAKKKYKPSEFDPNIKVTIYIAPVESVASSDHPDINIKNIKASFIPGLIYDGKVSLDWIGEKISFDLAKKEMIVQY